MTKGRSIVLNSSSDREGPATLSLTRQSAIKLHHVGHRQSIKDVSHSVAYFDHRKANDTRLYVIAILARLVGRATGAGDRRQWAIKSANNEPDVDVARRSRKHVAAAGAFFADDYSSVAKLSPFGNKDR